MMTRKPKVNFMRRGEEQEICDLVIHTFDACIAPLYSEKGVSEFKAYVTPKLLAKRSKQNHFVMVARQLGGIVGMIEVREYHHIALFFVEKSFQGKGIGKALFRTALTYCENQNPYLIELSVNSSPNAIAVYCQLGFRMIAGEQLKNGIRFVPMIFRVEPSLFHVDRGLIQESHHRP